jgi:hypothetical protein
MSPPEADTRILACSLLEVRCRLKSAENKAHQNKAKKSHLGIGNLFDGGVLD